MTRDEILREANPILFNTEMVKAILDDRKTVTRRVVKPKPEGNMSYGFYSDYPNAWVDDAFVKYISPYRPGNYLYVRETWQYAYDSDGNGRLVEETGRYVYAADNPNPFNCWVMPDGTERDTMPWRPSIHMPKEAARLFLRVKGVQVERLQDSFTAQGDTIKAMRDEGIDIGEQCRQCVENNVHPW